MRNTIMCNFVILFGYRMLTSRDLYFK